MPPLGATPFKVIVPVDVTPPVTGVGKIVKALTAGGVTVIEAGSVAPPAAAVKLMVVDVVTGDVVIGKVVDV